MICQRSGNCCLTMPVVIRVGDRAKLKPGGVVCPHLSFDGTEASCGVHDEPWYKDTPCYVYGNPDIDPDFAVKRGRPCMVGQYIQQRGGLKVVNPQAANTIAAEDLEDLGPWDGGV